ncbi:MAG: porin family protein [Prevotella sp.]|nr:PorT family protein [Bacteroidales bacterium]MDY4706348.1 porin family protein [Prevotella sp.]MCI7654629.1 PorT family protein [Bacteroidales bacterium]MDD7705114.1 porin family protein [Bacteroidales bacterium]MDY4950972.1 porin family protein [Prevotella sp.]
MKRILTFIAVALALLTTVPAQAQLKFGLKGGVNVTNMSFSSDVLDASNRAGFFVGPTVKFTLPIVGLGIDASALYDQREGKVKLAYKDVESENTVKQQQVVVPINLRYGVGLGSMASVFFFAGPQFGFNVGDKTQSIYDQVADWRLKSSNFSVNVGAGFMLMSHLQLSANYNIACGHTGDVELKSTAADALRQIKKGSRANAWQIGLAYYF